MFILMTNDSFLSCRGYILTFISFVRHEMAIFKSTYHHIVVLIYGSSCANEHISSIEKNGQIKFHRTTSVLNPFQVFNPIVEKSQTTPFSLRNHHFRMNHHQSDYTVDRVYILLYYYYLKNRQNEMANDGAKREKKSIKFGNLLHRHFWLRLLIAF